MVPSRASLKRQPTVRAVADEAVVAALREVVAGSPPDRSLPTTRELAKQLGISNTTVHRVLQGLADQGEIWQHPTSGRFYLPGARSLFAAIKPVACLIRRLELASEQYRELLEGISLGCGAVHRTMLLWHDALLVNHPVLHDSPVFASLAQQQSILGEFLDRHGSGAGAYILDHVWSDDALRQFAPRLHPAVVLYRTCTIEGFANVRADFRLGALMALAHLFGRGYERIIPVMPFAGDPAVNEFFRALERAAEDTGCRQRIEGVVPASRDQERAALVGRLQQEAARVALLCPEDNVTLLLTAAVRDAGIPCPERVGLLSVMGTDFATKAGISCLRYDFRLMGQLAVKEFERGEPPQHVIEPQLTCGVTT